MKYLAPLLLALVSCTSELPPADLFEFTSTKYHLDVVQITPLGCTRVEDDVYLSYNGIAVSLNDATALLDGEHLNIINRDQTKATRVPIKTLANRMVEQYTDSALMQFGTLHVYIKQ